MLLDCVLVLLTHLFEGLAEQSGIGRSIGMMEVVNPTGIHILCYSDCYHEINWSCDTYYAKIKTGSTVQSLAAWPQAPCDDFRM